MTRGILTLGVWTDAGWRSYDAHIFAGCTQSVANDRMYRASRTVRRLNRRGTRAQRRLKTVRAIQTVRKYMRNLPPCDGTAERSTWLD